MSCVFMRSSLNVLRAYLQRNEWMGGWVDRWMGGWVNRKMSGWVDGWIGGWVDGLIEK